jgi:mycothiol synthase
VNWADLTPADLDDVRGLATACLASDGGLQIADDLGFLRSRWSGDGTAGRTLRDPDNRLIAAGAVRPPGVFAGMVHPEARGQGLGEALLSWGLERAGPVIVETEGLTPAAEELFAAHGLRQTFAERVMRIDLTTRPPEVSWPAGAELLTWDQAAPERFHAVYVQAFRERPGFPNWSVDEFAAFVADDDEFRPEWSVLAVLPDIGDAGFITAGTGWIAQVGVTPPARGRGIGAALVIEALTRMHAGGTTEAWLDVNVNNPAHNLYRRLGFDYRGCRARYGRSTGTAPTHTSAIRPPANR